MASSEWWEAAVDLLGVAEQAEETGAFELDGVRFALHDLFPLGGDAAFSLIKPRTAIRAYAELLSRYTRPTIVELGIAYGGSVALLALAARPAALVAIEIDDEPVEALCDLIRDRGLEESILPRWGTDQSDRARLAEIVRDDLGGAPLDLVIDDASHQYEPTVASFETLFPHLRPGGSTSSRTGAATTAPPGCCARPSPTSRCRPMRGPRGSCRATPRSCRAVDGRWEPSRRSGWGR